MTHFCIGRFFSCTCVRNRCIRLCTCHSDGVDTIRCEIVRRALSSINEDKPHTPVVAYVICEEWRNPSLLFSTCRLLSDLIRITSVAWSLDGKKIASASSDTRLDRQTISIFDSQSGICNLILEGHTWAPPPAHAVFWISKKNWCELTCWELHSNTVRNVVFHPKNPHLLASCSDDGSIKIWNVSTGLCDTTLMGHSEGNHECKCKRGSRQFQNPDWQDFQVNPEWQDFQVNPECTVMGHSHRYVVQ